MNKIEADKKAIQHIKNRLSYLEGIESQVKRIVIIAQSNQEFFGGIPGQDMLELVADKLEQLVKENQD